VFAKSAPVQTRYHESRHAMSDAVTPDAAPMIDYRSQILRLWLLAVAGLIVVMVLVGGATRLTESGLSITEWQPVTGTLPPLSEDVWETEFKKYQEIPQYRELNRGMSLDEFKTIYYWEWGHRLLGRLIGVAYGLPFLWFLWRGWVGPGLRGRLWTVFGLGALQGAAGWWMVASGLTDRIEVSEYRLAFHLGLACVIFAALIWTAQRLLGRATIEAPPRLAGTARLMLVLVLLQIYLGALVAGIRAGFVFNTWPLIDDVMVPSLARLFFMQPPWRNLFENAMTVQFDHRMGAYAIWIVAVLHVVDVTRTVRGRALTTALALAAAVTLQAALGILTLIYVVPIGLALAHQATALIVLTCAVVHAEQLIVPRSLVAAARAKLAAAAAARSGKM
jgi:cytochrome c oxidase assembly protein subunit 15